MGSAAFGSNKLPKNDQLLKHNEAKGAAEAPTLLRLLLYKQPSNFCLTSTPSVRRRLKEI